MNKKWVKKSHGEEVPFDPEKLRVSLLKAGASEQLIKEIILQVYDSTDEITTTKLIYQKAYRLLKKASHALAGKYRLKEAILQLGPSGYPLEQYISHLLNYQGFKTEVGVIMKGKSLSHEVDVYATKDHLKIILESKHHSKQGYKSDVKVAMYVHSRYRDIINAVDRVEDQQNHRCVIATNTRFTLDAITYASSYDIQLISWDYPHHGSLKERIEISGLYPITCLHSLSQEEKKVLLDKQIVLCQQIIDKPEVLHFIKKEKQLKIINECTLLVQTG